MKLVPRIVLILLLLASCFVLYVEHNAKIKAQEALERFRTGLMAAQTDLAKQDAQGKAREMELKKLREVTKEIHKLRSDAAQLKTQQQLAQQLRAENQQLRSAPAPAAPAAQPTGDGTSLTKENWAFAGYATPEATLQSVSWAMREGDQKALLASLTEDEQTQMKERWANKTPEQIREEGQQEIREVTGYRIMEKNVVSADEVVVSVYVDGTSHLSKFSLKRVGNEWKFGGRAK